MSVLRFLNYRNHQLFIVNNRKGASPAAPKATRVIADDVDGISASEFCREVMLVDEGLFPFPNVSVGELVWLFTSNDADEDVDTRRDFFHGASLVVGV